MVMYSDALGDALKQFQLNDRERMIEAEVPFITYLEGTNLGKVIHPLGLDGADWASKVLAEATKYVIETFDGVLAYGHGAEVSLLQMVKDKQNKQLGSFTDRSSAVATAFSAAFVHFANEIDPPLFKAGFKKLVLPQFTAKTYVFPNQETASRFFVWRETHARNSAVETVAIKHFAINSLSGKSTIDRIRMLTEKQVDFHTLPEAFRRGTFVRRYKAARTLDAETLAKIPEYHRPKGDVMVMVVDRVANVPPLNLVDNLRSFIFDGAVPMEADRPFARAITP